MERFGSIKVNKNANQILNLCRLCGMNNPGMTIICEDFGQEIIDLDDDPTLQIKIEACIGILVLPNDQLPQYCCGICADKICDFYEFRLMCTSTEIQTRRILNLPLRNEKKAVIKQERGIKSEEPLLMEIAPPPDVLEDQRKQSNKRTKKILEPIISLKRIKIEPEEISCTVCKEKFVSEGDKYAHMYTIHVPSYSKFGCSSCGLSFNQVDWKQHRSWHMKRKMPFICCRCDESFDKFPAFSKHFQNNKCSVPPAVTQPDIHCELCRKRFSTRNLYEWHACFIKNKTNCRKCGQYYSAKTKLFTHFLKCPLPFIDVVPKKPAETQKTKVKKTEPRTADIKAESDLDIAALLETSIHETSKDQPCSSKISHLLSSVNDAIDKISAERQKSKDRKSKKKVTPMKIRIKPDPDAAPGGEEDDDATNDAPDEHFGNDDYDDDEDTTTSGTVTTTSGTVTPSVRIKQEKIDASYDQPEKQQETLQDLIRNIKKEPGVHTSEELQEAVKAFNDVTKVAKVKKAINPLAALKKKAKKSSPTRQQLILKIKKERQDTNEAPSGGIKKALNPFAAKKKKKLLKIPAQLALKIKKERSLNKETSIKNIPSIRIKQEKPDSDEDPLENHEESPADYFGINPLSILVQKNAQKKKNGLQSEEKVDESPKITETTTTPATTEEALKVPTKTSNPNPMSIFANKTGFMKLSLNSATTGLNFGSSSSQNEVQMPVIANVSSGVETNFHENEQLDSDKGGNDEVVEEKNTEERIDEKVPDELPEVVVEKVAEVPPKPKLGGFMKISGMTGGFLQFPGIQKSPIDSTSPSKPPSPPLSIVEDDIQVPASLPSNPPPPIIPGFLGLSSGFKKLTLPEPPAVSTNEPQHHTFPKSDVVSGISTSMDLDDLVSSPPSSQIDMESLLNEKLLDEEKNNSNCDTDDFLKEIDEQLGET